MKIKYHKLYKSSDFEWLGDIPEHWKTKRLKDIAKIIDCKNRTPEYFDDGEYLVIRTSNVRDGRINLDNPSFTNESNFLEWTKRGVPPLGSILFTREAPAGEVCLVPSEYKSCLGQRMMNFIPNKNDYSIYLLYYFLSCRTKCYLGSITSGSTVHHLRIPQVFDIPVIVPPLLEQKTIAHYLDTKTAQIDRKIDLLTQKATLYSNLKQSLINETVTRGLDKTVPMKDSGIEWIGEVPKHWKIKRVKELFEISRGRVIALTELVEDGHYPVYSSQTKDNGCLGYINTFDYEGEYVTWTTDGVNAGTVFMRRGQFNCTNICGTLKLKSKKQSITYFSYSLQVSTRHNKRIDTNGAKIMSNEMAFIQIVAASLSEQEAIADYLDTKTAQIDQIIQTINTQIEKLKELRKTLINDVVTGKIKIVDN